jgi:hypothetical protein
MAKIHLVLQGKGGVAKTTTAVFVAQYYKEHKQDVLLIDTDQVNKSFAAFKALGVQPLSIMKDNEIDPRGWDILVEKAYKTQCDVVIDNGASSFISILGYMLENDLPGLLKEGGHEMYFHIPVAGSESLGHTLNGLVSIIDQFQESPVNYAVWLNSFLGPIEKNGQRFYEFEEIKPRLQRLAAIIETPQYSAGTFGEDIRYMLSNNFTFDEMLSGENGTTIASMQRYRKIRSDIFEILRASQLFAFPSKLKSKDK